jgi:hypothetical protein
MIKLNLTQRSETLNELNGIQARLGTLSNSEKDLLRAYLFSQWKKMGYVKVKREKTDFAEKLPISAKILEEPYKEPPIPDRHGLESDSHTLCFMCGNPLFMRFNPERDEYDPNRLFCTKCRRYSLSQNQHVERLTKEYEPHFVSPILVTGRLVECI